MFALSLFRVDPRFVRRILRFIRKELKDVYDNFFTNVDAEERKGGRDFNGFFSSNFILHHNSMFLGRVTQCTVIFKSSISGSWNFVPKRHLTSSTRPVVFNLNQWNKQPVRQKQKYTLIFCIKLIFECQ
jgi:hypothetical protein